MTKEKIEKNSVCIIGGAGHIGLPLGIVFANSGMATTVLDINKNNLNKITKGIMPFKETNGTKELKQALKSKKFIATANPKSISSADFIVLVIGTPIDEHLNPDFKGIMSLIKKYAAYFKDGQTLILRSTVYPGTSERIQNFFIKKKKKVHIAFCPERIVEGKALIELKEIAQIVSAFDNKTLEKVAKLFSRITPHIIKTKQPIEAELAKLFSNSWRYIIFAVANQFYTMANDKGLDYHAIHKIMTDQYPRNHALPKPGFAAGPCLFKDTMQLAAFNRNNFMLGHSAMLVNEGLPYFIIQKLKEEVDLNKKTIGILGMAFKADSDDNRESLSYKLWKIADTESKQVFCSDPYIADTSFISEDELIKKSDIVILATPHKKYKKINPKKYPYKKFVDIWGYWE